MSDKINFGEEILADCNIDCDKQANNKIETAEGRYIEKLNMDNAGYKNIENVKRENAECKNVEKLNMENGAEGKTEAVGNIEKTQLFGKFKNPQELLRAYGELEKEFTKRSQKLSKLEGENLKDGKSESERECKPGSESGKGNKPESESGRECKLESESGKGNKPESAADNNATFAVEDEKWRAEVDKFFDETPSARPFARQIALELIENPELKEKNNCLASALNQVLINEFRTPEQLMSDGEFLKKYVLSSSSIKDTIIQEYLADLESGKPPVTLTRGGTMAAACKSLPKNFDEAGKMFLKYNNN